MSTMEKNVKLKFVILLLGSIIFCISYGGGQHDFFTMLLSSYSYKGTILLLLGIIIYNAIDIIKNINGNYLYLCRFENVQAYYKRVIIEVIKSNLKILLIFLLLIIAFSIFGCYNNYNLPTTFYGLNFIIIVIYYTIKLAILCILFSVITVFVYSSFKNIGIAIYSLILICCALIDNSQEDIVISKITQFPINYIEYLYPHEYASIFYDLIAFVLFVSIILVIISILKYICFKKRGDILE